MRITKNNMIYKSGLIKLEFIEMHSIIDFLHYYYYTK